MKTPLSKYFLAIIPPEPIVSEVYKIKAHIRDKYDSKAALRSPPHITLHMPFLWKEKKEQLLLDKLVHASKNFKTFEITLNNFEAFGPRVIYIVVGQDENLMLLQAGLEDFAKKELNLFNATRYALPYYPHMTVAFRDLKKEVFPLAWDEFKNKRYEATFEVSSIHLLKHDGKSWQLLKEFQLSKE